MCPKCQTQDKNRYDLVKANRWFCNNCKKQVVPEAKDIARKYVHLSRKYTGMEEQSWWKEINNDYNELRDYGRPTSNGSTRSEKSTCTTKRESRDSEGKACEVLNIMLQALTLKFVTWDRCPPKNPCSHCQGSGRRSDQKSRCGKECCKRRKKKKSELFVVKKVGGKYV